MPSQSSQLKFRRILKLLGCATTMFLVPLPSFGQTAITAWTLGSSDAADSTAYGDTFRNSTFNVVNFTAGTTKTVDSSATTTFIRRSSAGGNSNVWTVRDGTTGSNIRAMNPSSGTLATVLSGNNVLQGANDLFTNTNGSPAATANSNVERIDFYWNGGFTSVSDQGFAVFDRGSNDTFQIAVITGWDTVNNRPTAYGATKEIASSSYGANLAADWVAGGGTETTFEATFLRFATDSTLTTLDSTQNSTGQGIGGVFVSFADLGIANGTTIYGYSLMATDVSNTAANLVDWTNATYYPTTTTDTVGSIDLAGFNGRRFVPEPAKYGAVLLFFTVAAVAIRRRPVAAPARVRVRN